MEFQYSTYVVDEPLTVYATNDTALDRSIIPVGSFIVLRKEERNFREVNYGGLSGYILPRKFKAEKAYSNYSFVRPLERSAYGARKALYKESPPRTDSINRTRSGFYSEPKSTYSGGPVQVKGYYRKDGTYVKPHTRSAPKRKG
jgi:hypothetical protein